jgi:general stress protein YciG
MANNRNTDRGGMTVAEAGRKGGDTTASTHDRSFYQQIGHMGGQRVRELINKGKGQESGSY